jgi:hypothetical protein
MKLPTFVFITPQKSAPEIQILIAPTTEQSGKGIKSLLK